MNLKKRKESNKKNKSKKSRGGGTKVKFDENNHTQLDENSFLNVNDMMEEDGMKIET